MNRKRKSLLGFFINHVIFGVFQYDLEPPKHTLDLRNFVLINVFSLHLQMNASRLCSTVCLWGNNHQKEGHVAQPSEVLVFGTATGFSVTCARSCNRRPKFRLDPRFWPKITPCPRFWPKIATRAILGFEHRFCIAPIFTNADAHIFWSVLAWFSCLINEQSVNRCVHYHHHRCFCTKNRK